MKKIAKIISFNKLLFTILLIFSLLFPAKKLFAAGLVPCGLGASDPCTLCHLFVLIKNIIDFGMGILIVVSILGIVIAGVMYVVSAGTSTMMTKAKALTTNVVIGFALMLGAWLIVYTALTMLSVKADMGIGKSAWNTFECSTVSSSTSITEAGQGGLPANPVAPSDMVFQAGIAAQYADASPELQNLLSCMYNHIPQGEERAFITITSISDGNGGPNCYTDHPTWRQCTAPAQTNCCFHKSTSCHYGGTSCQGKSYAADIDYSNFVGDEGTSSEITAIATTCGAKSLVEGSHVHISIPGGCGCDVNL